MTIIYPRPLIALMSVISSAYSMYPAFGSHFESLDILRVSFFGIRPSM